VVTHELGHVLGFASIDPSILDHDWMTATLGTGVRRSPTPAQEHGTATPVDEVPSAVEGGNWSPGPAPATTNVTSDASPLLPASAVQSPLPPGVSTGPTPAPVQPTNQNPAMLPIGLALPPTVIDRGLGVMGPDLPVFESRLPWEEPPLAIGGPAVDDTRTAPGGWAEEPANTETPGLFPPGWQDETSRPRAEGRVWWFEGGAWDGLNELP
jgi:hypothetical protein